MRRRKKVASVFLLIVIVSLCGACGADNLTDLEVGQKLVDAEFDYYYGSMVEDKEHFYAEIISTESEEVWEYNNKYNRFVYSQGDSSAKENGVDLNEKVSVSTSTFEENRKLSEKEIKEYISHSHKSLRKIGLNTGRVEKLLITKVSEMAEHYKQLSDRELLIEEYPNSKEKIDELSDEDVMAVAEIYKHSKTLMSFEELKEGVFFNKTSVPDEVQTRVKRLRNLLYKDKINYELLNPKVVKNDILNVIEYEITYNSAECGFRIKYMYEKESPYIFRKILLTNDSPSRSGVDGDEMIELLMLVIESHDVSIDNNQALSLIAQSSEHNVIISFNDYMYNTEMRGGLKFKIEKEKSQSGEKYDYSYTNF